VIHSSGFPVTRGGSISLPRTSAAAEHVAPTITGFGRKRSTAESSPAESRRSGFPAPLVLERPIPRKKCPERVGVALAKRLIETEARIPLNVPVDCKPCGIVVDEHQPARLRHPTQP